MQGSHEVVVLRYGHRPGRDDRMTTHVGLTARALGADRVLFPDNATQAAETVADITDRFGGPFEIEQTDSQAAIVRNWNGPVVHLTMYGEPIQDVEGEIRAGVDTDPCLSSSAARRFPSNSTNTPTGTSVSRISPTRRSPDWRCFWIDSSMAGS